MKPPTRPDPFNLKKCLRVAMAMKLMTNKSLAKELGVLPAQICNWRTHGPLPMSRLKSVLKALDMERDPFFKLGE